MASRLPGSKNIVGRAGCCANGTSASDANQLLRWRHVTHSPAVDELPRRRGEGRDSGGARRAMSRTLRGRVTREPCEQLPAVLRFEGRSRRRPGRAKQGRCRAYEATVDPRDRCAEACADARPNLHGRRCARCVRQPVRRHADQPGKDSEWVAHHSGVLAMIVGVVEPCRQTPARGRALGWHGHR